MPEQRKVAQYDPRWAIATPDGQWDYEAEFARTRAALTGKGLPPLAVLKPAAPHRPNNGTSSEAFKRRLQITRQRFQNG